jgi:hypothetical protein
MNGVRSHMGYITQKTHDLKFIIIENSDLLL